MRTLTSLFTGGLIAAFSLGSPTSAVAEEANLPLEGAVIEAGPGQRALLIKVDGELLRVRACASTKPGKCDPTANGSAMLRPPEAVRAHLSKARVNDLRLPGGKHAALVTVPAGSRSYGVLLASPDRKSDAPRILYSGFMNDADTKVALVEEGKAGKGSTTVRITSNASLCGKELVTSVRTLDGASLTLKEQEIADPGAPSRAGALPLTAAGVTAPKPTFALLVAQDASSGRSALATDRDSATSWLGLRRAGAGKTFLSLRAPGAVPIEGFEIALTPPKDNPEARAPRNLLIVTDQQSFNVTIPSDIAVPDGAQTVVGVTLPKAVVTRCVGVIVDGVRGDADKKGKDTGATVFITELSARTSADAESLATLAEGLGAASVGASKVDAKLAESILAAEGRRGVMAIAAAYPKLDGPARDRARRIVDARDCSDAMLLYLPLLTGIDTDESARARDRIRRCGDEAGPLLLAAIEATKEDEARGVIAEEAALIAPALATKPLVAYLGAAKTSEERRVYRRALAKGALRAAGVKALDATMADPSFVALGVAAKIDVLRALGPQIGQAKSAASVFASVSGAATEFRDRYLLVAPAADLARSGDVAALAWMQASLAPANDPRLRARVAELGGGIEALRPVLVAAVDDDQVRVREAALLSLVTGGKGVDAAVSSKLIERLEKDPWTFVRRAAATALGNAPKDATLDARIAVALVNEEQPSVRVEMLEALGKRGAVAQVEAVRERALDEGEALNVRLKAVEAIGLMCDRGSADALTELAMRGRAPLFETDRKLAIVGILTLGKLRPADLKQRLSPLLAKEISAEMRELATKTLADTSLAGPAVCKP